MVEGKEDRLRGLRDDLLIAQESLSARGGMKRGRWMEVLPAYRYYQGSLYLSSMEATAYWQEKRRGMKA